MHGLAQITNESVSLHLGPSLKEQTAKKKKKNRFANYCKPKNQRNISFTLRINKKVSLNEIFRFVSLRFVNEHKLLCKRKVERAREKRLNGTGLLLLLEYSPNFPSASIT